MDTAIQSELTAKGFYVEAMGGGCTAWKAPVTGGYLLVTHMDGGTHDIDASDEVMIGHYRDEDAEPQSYWQTTGRDLFAELDDAIASINGY